MDYGARFKQIRKARWKGTVLQLAGQLGSPYPPTIYNIERAWRVPTLPTIAKHAAALGCEPWELLEDVETEYDRLRKIGHLPHAEAVTRWRDLMARYEESTSRGSRGKAARVRTGAQPTTAQRFPRRASTTTPLKGLKRAGR